jgi:recombination protein RecA
LDIRKTGSAIKDKEGNVVGNHVKVKVAKNKLAPPFRIALFDIVYGKGISKTGEIVDLGVEYDIIGKSGSWYSYDEAKIAQGREAAKIFLEDNPEVAFEIEQKIKVEILGPGAIKDTTDGKAEKKSKKKVEE